MKYALFHWYQGEGNNYTYLGELTKEEHDNYVSQPFSNFVLFPCHCNIDRQLTDRVYFDNKGNSYVYLDKTWKTGYA